MVPADGSARTGIRRRPPTCAIGRWTDDVHPVLRRVYAARGIADAAGIDHRLGALASPDPLGGLDTACALLAEALVRDWRITIVGDFDCDGATGTAIGVRGLRLLGAKHVAYRVPNRALHGYGLGPALVAELADDAPDLIVTVDNGVASHAGIAAAKALGIRVIVTDHHLPGADLPAAAAIVNPNLPGDGFPSKALAGCGVLFYVLLALRARLREAGWFARRGIAEPDLAELLDLVALGTVADMVPLDFNNRVLVAAGLRRIRARRACAGVLALVEASGREPARLHAQDLGFLVAPRLNAAGRLDDMGLGIECLLADDADVAHTHAQRLSALNAERRAMQATMVEHGESLVAQWLAEHGADSLPFGLVLFDADWHAGVVGLLASKLKERLHRPVIACAPAGEDSDEVRGSARSIPGLHVRDALADVDARHPGLILRFGGHAMAAGLTMRREAIPQLAAAFDAIVRERLSADALDPEIWSDGELDAADFNLDLARALQEGGPWGQAFPEPLFDNEFSLVSWRVMGERHRRLELRHAGRAEPLTAILFNAADGMVPPARLRAAYQLVADEWNGRERLRLLLRHVEAL
jgi:single-stranded-DNA-specific exonuclease